MISAMECRERHAKAVLEFKAETTGKNVDIVLEFIGGRLEEASLCRGERSYEVISVLVQKKPSLMMLNVSDNEKNEQYKVWADMEVVKARLGEAGYKVEIDDLGVARQYLRIYW